MFNKYVCIIMLFMCGCGQHKQPVCINPQSVGILRHNDHIIGTAFATNNNTIITARHVLPSDTLNNLFINNYAIHIRNYNKFGYDAASICVDHIPFELSRIPVDNYIRRGMDIVIIGYAVDNGVARYQIKRGKILTRIATSALIEPGMSGSPVINVSNGKVVAVAYSFIPDLGVTEIIPMGELK
ncbi:MAG: hypothetical protein GF411_08810 [Candidatus Lokiarchaeota archaeon]|nr:hypothetical protein [Candidatus Lokiarchaeota archaeon]